MYIILIIIIICVFPMEWWVQYKYSKPKLCWVDDVVAELQDYRNPFSPPSIPFASHSKYHNFRINQLLWWEDALTA